MGQRKPPREDVLGWIAGGMSIADAARKSGYGERTIRRWREGRPPESAAELGPSPGAARAREAAALSPDDTNDLLTIVRTSRQIARDVLGSWRRAIAVQRAADPDMPITIDRDTASALASLAQAERAYLAAHPGLMAEVERTKTGPSGIEGEAELLAKALEAAPKA